MLLGFAATGIAGFASAGAGLLTAGVAGDTGLAAGLQQEPLALVLQRERLVLLVSQLA